MSLQPGQRFGKYEIVELIGKGGMGEVYLATDARLNRPVAIKIISPKLAETRELLARFQKEAGYAAVLNHPNICTVYESGEIDAQTYFCMEYIEGKTLRERIAEKPMPLTEVLDVAIQIADGLDEARKKNIVHRDIKTANVLITPRGTVKIMDFGLAKQIDTGSSSLSSALTSTQSGDILGTFAYMSPEQALGKKVDHRSDIFSFGIVVYEMLAGRLPFTGESTTEVVDNILHSPPPPVTRYNDSVPEDLVRILSKMLEKDLEERYQSVHEVWVDLRRLRGDTSAGLATATKRFKKSKPRRIPLVPIIAALLIVAAIAAAIFYFTRRNEQPVSTGVTSKVKEISIAVLPFRYVGDDPTRMYLGTLVTDGLIAALQPVPALEVVPYGTVRQMQDAPASDLARELGVRWIVKGTASVAGENAQIKVQLASTDGKEILNNTFTGRSVAVCDLAKRAVVQALHLTDSNGRDVGQLRTPTEEAYKLYLQARNLVEGWDVQKNLDTAADYYRQAIERDPDFAAARAGLAMTLLNQFHLNRNATLLAAAGEEARRALGLDSNLPESLLAFGMVQAESGNSIEARDAFTRALELAPGDDSACRNFASLYAELGRNNEAEQLYEQAIELRPNFWRNHYDLGTFEWQYAGNLDKARLHLKKANQLHPEGFAPLVVLGNIELTQGNLDGAENWFRKALERSTNPSAYSNLGLVHYYRGQYDLALRNWQAVLKEMPEKPLYQANVADALRQLGRQKEANEYYEEVVKKFRAEIKANPSNDKSRESMAMALAAIGRCKEAMEETRGVLARHPDSPELAAYAAITISRCGDKGWAKQIVLNSIATDNLLTIKFDPDLRLIRDLPEVKQALDRVETSSTASEHQ